MSDLLTKLNNALKFKGGNATAGNFRHENEIAILEAAKKLLIKSEIGQQLLAFANDHNIEIHVLRNKTDFGFLPSKSVVYISCPAGQSMPPARAVIHLAGALREAVQDTAIDHLHRPNINQPADLYTKTQVDKKADQIHTQCAVAYEIFMKTGLLEIVDELTFMGYADLYEAYKRDLNP